jgi:hypothetical protein
VTLSRAGAFLLGVALILGGCGSSTLSSKQLLSSATQICQNANRKAARIAVPASPAQAQAFLARGITTLTPELEQLKQLRPERSEAATFHAAVDALSRELLELRRTQQRLRHDADPVAAMESLQGRLGPLRAEGDTRWRQLGIFACVSR